MSYQKIRGAIEAATRDVLILGRVTNIYYDNVAYEEPPTDQPHAQIAITFTGVKEDVVGCCGVDDIDGVVTLYIRTPTGSGSSTGESNALAVLRMWAHTAEPTGALGDAHVRMRQLEGPLRVFRDPERNTTMGGRTMAFNTHTISASFRGKLVD
jgi:hypothetical protein